VPGLVGQREARRAGRRHRGQLHQVGGAGGDAGRDSGGPDQQALLVLADPDDHVADDGREDQGRDDDLDDDEARQAPRPRRGCVVSHGPHAVHTMASGPGQPAAAAIMTATSSAAWL
jgi:hypothetical protein